MTTSVPTTMTAYRLKPGQSQVIAETIGVPKPAADQVLVKVLAAGVCHTDLGLFNSDAGVQARLNPEGKTFTLGHEGAGDLRFINFREVYELNSKL